MLDFLHIENVAVAKNIDISLPDGFNVFTGETGAGKSVIIDSISLLLGAKASKEIIRQGEDRAFVSALFSDVGDEVYAACDEYGIPYDRDDAFSLSRAITSDGKSTVKINSRASTLVQLKAIGQQLINIHGQNENQGFI
ncbi:MAG: AAA family ATPase, partial [Eubacteriales bacterium]